MALYLSDIVSVSGKPGLHKLVGQRSNGLIVESLDATKKRAKLIWNLPSSKPFRKN